MPKKVPPSKYENLMTKCKDNHPIEFGRRKKQKDAKNNYCDIANNEPLAPKADPDKEYWRCDKLECDTTKYSSAYCSDCYIKNFIRRQLEKKTRHHYFYENYEIQSINKQDSLADTERKS